MRKKYILPVSQFCIPRTCRTCWTKLGKDPIGSNLSGGGNSNCETLWSDPTSDWERLGSTGDPINM